MSQLYAEKDVIYLDIPDEVRDGRTHPALYVDLRHRVSRVREPLHERAVELVQLVSDSAIHR